MIETIWPLSDVSCNRESAVSHNQQNLIGLRTFVQEVLKRSRTSYSTLQVALYYLILIQSCLPKHDFTMEQQEDSSACRAMQCGRRMFLAALILASKYLQDRNFSARAWSKISGLRTCEINQNEMAFLAAVKWKLHIPERIFKRWVDIVLKYSPSAQVNTPRSYPSSGRTWKSIIPLLTPALDSSEFKSMPSSDYSGHNFPGSEMNPPPVPVRQRPQLNAAAAELTPVNTYSGSAPLTPITPYTVPRNLRLTSIMDNSEQPTMPTLPRLPPLPTPEMTPQTGTICTPAVSASGFCPGKRSMGVAMAQIKSNCLARSTLDGAQTWPTPMVTPRPCSISSRQTPCSDLASSKSSPESSISEISTRSSRSTSISSVASSGCALPPPKLALQARRRCARMQGCGLKGPGQRPSVDFNDRSGQTFAGARDAQRSLAPSGFRPDVNSTHSTTLDFKCGNCEEAGHISRDCQRVWVNGQLSSPPKATARSFDAHQCKSLAGPVSSSHAELSPREAAVTLQDIAQSQILSSPDHSDEAILTPRRLEKRARPTSLDDFSQLGGALQEMINDGELQAAVRARIAPRCLGDITNQQSRWNEEDGRVLRDPKLADSFLGSKNGSKKPLLNTVDVDSEFSYQTRGKPTTSKQCLPRKKARAEREKCGRSKTVTLSQSMNEKMISMHSGPGMWDGILN